MDLTEELVNEIDAYLSNRMSDPVRQAFQQRMDEDPALKQEVATQAHMHQGLEAVLMQRRLAALRTGGIRQWRVQQRGRLAGAFLLIGLLFTGGFYALRYAQALTPAEAFTAYYEVLPGPRGDAPLVAGISKACAAYDAKQYTRALSLLNALPMDPLRQVSLYRGVTLLALNRPQMALKALNVAAQSPDQATRQFADWYGALANLKAGNADSARIRLQAIRSDKTHLYRNLAGELLEKLR